MKKTVLIPILLITVGFVGCGEVDLNQQSDSTSSFKGDKGDFIAIEDNQILIYVDEVDDGVAHYFNTTLPNGNPVYFFIVKSPDGKLRAAANGCQVCGNALQGFHQEGNDMVCNTCGNRYPLDKIATEKGGCNPAPINPDLEIEDGQVSITLSELKEIEQFF